MKKILFPTDFSPVATNAFIHALEFAKIVHAEIVLLHTFEIPMYDTQFFPANYAILYDSLALSQFDAFKEQVPMLRELAEGRNLQNIKLSHRLTEGDLLSNIVAIIQEEHIDFIIMGTAGASGWDAFFMGTHTANSISATNVPLLCVPEQAIFKPISVIGFTTRFRTKDKKALKKVLNIARKTNAIVKCLYVKTSNSDVTKETIAAWEEEFSADPVQFHVIHSDEVATSIEDFIQYKEIDVLTMLPYKRSFFEGIFNPSLTKKMARNLEIPILAIPVE